MEKSSYIRNLYGRRIDKPLRARPARLMQELLPEFSIKFEDGNNPLDELFSQDRETWLEVGFGGGEHLAAQAIKNPEVTLIGAEPFVNGVAKTLSLIDQDNIENIRIHFGDARPLIEALPDESISKIFVLHPDPWPKRRHHKRRMINSWFTEEAARILKNNGEARIASDIPDYIQWTLMHFQNSSEFQWRAKEMNDWKVRPDDWPQTRYEIKALKDGRRPTYLSFERLARL